MKKGKVKIGLIVVLVITAALVITASLMVLNFVNKNKENNPPINNGGENNNNNGNNQNPGNNNGQNNGYTPTPAPSGGEEEPAGTKNTSEKLNTTRTFDGLEIKDIELIQGDEFATFTATVKNNKGSDISQNVLQIEFVTKDGTIIDTIDTSINAIKNGDTTTINAVSGVNLTDASDFNLKYRIKK